MRKFYAKRSVVVDGHQFNRGDIVMAEEQVPGLELAPQEPPPVKVRPRWTVNMLCGQAGVTPVISVVVTFHMQRQYVQECLEGFMRQSLTMPYEIIAVVDDSPDGTADFIRRSFPAVQVCEVHFKSAPMSRNYGYAQAHAEGGYVVFFDGDDFPYGEYLEKLFVALAKNPIASFSYSRYTHARYGVDKGRLGRCGNLEWSKSWNRYSPITNTPCMVRRGKLDIFWDERLGCMQDAAFCLSLTRQGARGIHVREELWEYRQHAGSMWGGGRGDISEIKKAAMAILENEYGLKTDRGEVTFCSLISRNVVLKEYFAQIPGLGLPAASHWMIFIDTDSQELVDVVQRYADQYADQFLSVRVYVTWQPSLAYGRDFESRGMRIANFIKVFINQANEKFGGTPYMFMVEDDTLAPRDAFPRLWKTFNGDPNIIYTSGIECGRGFTQHTGVCTLVTVAGEIVGRKIPMMQKEGIVEIEGGGWYCWIGRVRELARYYENNPMRCFDGKMLGPDVMMIYDLRRAGYMALCDMSVQCLHYNDKRHTWLEASSGRGYDIEYHKDEWGKWVMELEELCPEKTKIQMKI